MKKHKLKTKQWALFVNGQVYGKTGLLYRQKAPTIFEFMNGSDFEPIQRSSTVTLEVKEVRVVAV